MPAFAKGDRVGGFIVEDEIQAGQFSETWICKNPISGRKAVLKGLKSELLNPDDETLYQLDLVARTREQAKILTALSGNSVRSTRRWPTSFASNSFYSNSSGPATPKGWHCVLPSSIHIWPTNFAIRRPSRSD